MQGMKKTQHSRLDAEDIGQSFAGFVRQGVRLAEPPVPQSPRMIHQLHRLGFLLHGLGRSARSDGARAAEAAPLPALTHPRCASLKCLSHPLPAPSHGNQGASRGVQPQAGPALGFPLLKKCTWAERGL